MSAPDVVGLLGALARVTSDPAARARLRVSQDALRSARALRDGRRLPAPRRRAYSPSLVAYAMRRHRDARGRFVLVALLALVLAGGCASPAVTSLDQAHAVTLSDLPAPQVIAYSGRVTGEQRAPCYAGADGSQPDPTCTPGSIGETRVEAVCAPRFEAAHRVDVTKPRLVAMQAYEVPIEDSATTEYDHRIPLSLGGANDVSNLWPERSDLVGKGVRNGKDSIEYSVWYAVCKASPRTVALADAQRAFMGDWRDALRVLKIRATNSPPGVAAD